MGRYLLKRLLIAIPSLLGISVILFTVLALAPGDPFGELRRNELRLTHLRILRRQRFALRLIQPQRAPLAVRRMSAKTAKIVPFGKAVVPLFVPA